MLQTAAKSTSPVSLASFKQWLGVTSRGTKTISSLTSTGLVATAVCAAHGLQTNAFVQIAGAVEAAYDGFFLVTVIDANTFTFALPTTGSSPATGTPTMTVDDGRYAAMINAAADIIERQIDVPFVTRTITEVRSGTGQTAIALWNAPIVSITSVTMDGSLQGSSTYTFDAESGILAFVDAAGIPQNVFSIGTRNITIVYVAGYDAQDGAALPGDVVTATLDLAKAYHDALVTNAIAATTVSLGPATMVIKPAGIPPSVQSVIDAWDGKAWRP